MEQNVAVLFNINNWVNTRRFFYTITLVYKIFQHAFNITRYEEMSKSGGIYGDNKKCPQTDGLVLPFLFWALQTTAQDHKWHIVFVMKDVILA